MTDDEITEAEWKQLFDRMEQHNQRHVEKDAVEEYLDFFRSEWMSYDPLALPTRYVLQVTQWARRGVDKALVSDAIAGAMAKDDIRGGDDGRFKYCAAIIRSTLDGQSEPRKRRRAPDEVTAPSTAWLDGYLTGVREGRDDLYEDVQDLIVCVRDLLDLLAPDRHQ